ncbi:hypothetical protein [Synechococcus lacustris]|uniref:hypothetical protein n=1 Tax=Synechococcus lacustris TaxID=2116544 RepID=UPI0020CD4C31|nr:hypothetical protein [Synechococcus lacustris]
MIEELFEIIEGYLRDQGLVARGGQIIDANLVPVPKLRNTREKTKASSLMECQMEGNKTKIDTCRRI